MKADVGILSDREREALKLLAQGHEAKSIASALDVSVHTVNERLRGARRKLGVSSSREAARLLRAHEAESADPDNLGHKKIGIAPARSAEAYRSDAQSGASGARRRLIWLMIGAIMLTVLVSALIATQPTSHGPRSAEPVSPLPTLFAVSDYPAEALAKHAQGITDFRLRVGGNGRVEKCEIERSSGSAALDEATCQVITRRARFRPAVNRTGRPVASVYTGMIHWIL